MKYFGTIVLVCIFQSIHFSFACYGHSVQMVEMECGQNNNIKIEEGYHIELTDDCKVLIGGYISVDRPFRSALLSVKGGTSFMNATVLKNKDFCKVLAFLNVNMECPLIKPGRILVELEKPVDISMNYGPLLAFAVGQVNIAAMITYDGDDANPDKFAFVVNVTRNDNDLGWLLGSR